MFYKVNNLGNVEYFDSELAANTKLAEIQKAYLEQNDYVFTIAKEVVNGNETTWMNADLENDPEDYKYHVFNTLTGLHEEVMSLSEAKKLQERIKQEFIVHSNIDKFEIVETKPKNLELYSINNGIITPNNSNPFTL
jgi:hypothetical protein